MIKQFLSFYKVSGDDSGYNQHGRLLFLNETHDNSSWNSCSDPLEVDFLSWITPRVKSHRFNPTEHPSSYFPYLLDAVARYARHDSQIPLTASTSFHPHHGWLLLWTHHLHFLSSACKHHFTLPHFPFPLNCLAVRGKVSVLLTISVISPTFH